MILKDTLREIIQSQKENLSLDKEIYPKGEGF
jgi:hypothetical protein